MLFNILRIFSRRSKPSDAFRTDSVTSPTTLQASGLERAELFRVVPDRLARSEPVPRRLRPRSRNPVWNVRNCSATFRTTGGLERAELFRDVPNCLACSEPVPGRSRPGPRAPVWNVRNCSATFQTEGGLERAELFRDVPDCLTVSNRFRCVPDQAPRWSHVGPKSIQVF